MPQVILLPTCFYSILCYNIEIVEIAFHFSVATYVSSRNGRNKAELLSLYPLKENLLSKDVPCSFYGTSCRMSRTFPQEEEPLKFSVLAKFWKVPLS